MYFSSKCTHFQLCNLDGRWEALALCRKMPSLALGVTGQKLYLALFQEILKTTSAIKIIFVPVRISSTVQRDKRQTNAAGHEPPLLSNEIKWQLLSEEGAAERREERGHGREVGGGGVGGFCPARKLKPSQANWVQVLLVGKSRPINLADYSAAVRRTEGHLGI